MHTVHHHYNNKSSWSLTPTRKVILMGDSNNKMFPPLADPNIQVDSYPGAKLVHATQILRKITNPVPEVSNVVLSFGINNRSSGTEDTLNPIKKRKKSPAIMRA